MKRRIDLKEINSIVGQELEKLKLQHQLNNLSEDNITLKISNSRNKTILLIRRYRHRPFELEITVDYALSNQRDIVHVKRSNRRNQGNRGPYFQFRLLWLILIFAGVIISILNSLVGGFQTLIDRVLPGLSSVQQAIVVIGSSIGFFFIWTFFNPRIQEYFHKKNRSFDAFILGAINKRLKEIVKLSEMTVVKRCWSCFKVVNKDIKCKNCGKQQN